MWLVIVLSVATLLTVYLGWRLINPAPLPLRWKLMGWLTVALLLYGQRLVWVLSRSGQREGVLFTLFDWAGYTFLGLVSLVAVMMVVRDIPILIQRTLSGIRKLTVRRSKRPYFIEPNRERRRFLLNATNAAILTTAVPLAGFAFYEARREPTVIRNELKVIGLPDGLDGFTIAQISDTHIGPTIGRDWVRMVVDDVNALGADMIVHTGDMVDGSVAQLKDSVRPLADLKAPYGVWMCTGNHEYYSGVEQWLAEARRLGMTPLNNENRIIDTGKGRLLLAGVTDYRSAQRYPAHQSSPGQAKSNAPEHDVSILLAHQPVSVYEASQARFDVQLSGHTHGGQFFPWTLAIHLFQPYVRGLNQHENTLLYINVGTGYWGPPMRLGTEPEISLHTLRKA